MTTARPLLDVRHLAIHTDAGLPLVKPLSLQVNCREMVALVGNPVPVKR